MFAGPIYDFVSLFFSSLKRLKQRITKSDCPPVLPTYCHLFLEHILPFWQPFFLINAMFVIASIFLSGLALLNYAQQNFTWLNHCCIFHCFSYLINFIKNIMKSDWPLFLIVILTHWTAIPLLDSAHLIHYDGPVHYCLSI